MPVRLFFLFIISSFASVVIASDSKVQEILSSTNTPSGVVFEIAGSDPVALKWAIPRIKQYVVRLRKKFPKMELAVVTHGREQFALQKSNSSEYKKVHNEVKLLAGADVPVHICQTFAGWSGVDPEDFPDYVSVSATGPQQVKDYLELGYTLIKIRAH